MKRIKLQGYGRKKGLIEEDSIQFNLGAEYTEWNYISYNLVDHGRRIQTTNGLERINKELKSRTRPPVAKVLSASAFKRSNGLLIQMRKKCEGSLHPRPEGRGIRDPPRSRSNK